MHPVRVSTNDVVKFIMDNIKIMNKVDTVTYTAHDSDKSDETEINKKYASPEFPPKLNDIFEQFDNFSRMGVIVKMDDKDISFFTSVFSCISDVFRNLDQTSQINFIKKFLTSFHKDIMYESYQKFGYATLKWNKKELMADVSNININKHVMRYFADYVHVNIFIVDLELDAIIFLGDKFNQYMKNVFIIHFDDSHFEPLVSDEYIFSHDSMLIKYLLENQYNIDMFNLDYRANATVPTFELITEDLSRFEEDESDNNDEDIIVSKNSYKESDNESVVSEISDIETKIDSTLSMKELREIAKKHKVTITYLVDGKTRIKSKTMLANDINKSIKK